MCHRRRSWVNSWLKNISSSWIMVILKHLHSSLVVTMSIVSLDWSCSCIICYLLSEWTSSYEFGLHIYLSIRRNIFWIIYILICHLLGLGDPSIYSIYTHHLLLNHIMLLFLFSLPMTLLCIFTWLLVFNYK